MTHKPDGDFHPPEWEGMRSDLETVRIDPCGMVPRLVLARNPTSEGGLTLCDIGVELVKAEIVKGEIV